MTGHIVLLFHSVDDRGLLSTKNLGNVLPVSFEKVIAGLRKEFDVVSMEEMIGCIAGRERRQERLLSVTFDDGPKSYVANALPVMEAFNLPSTCFLITDCVGDRTIYWRYLYNFCVNSGHGRALAGLISGEYGAEVEEEQIVSFTRRTFSRKNNERVMGRILTDIVSEDEYREKEQELFLSAGDLERLKNHHLVNLGIHTRTHPVMSGLSDDEIRDEISGSLEFCRDRVGHGVPMFSVPFGRLYRDYDERTVRIARDLSVRAVLSAYGGVNRYDQPLYNIRRIPVYEEMLDGGFSSFLSRLKERCEVDDYAGREERLREEVEASPSRS